MGVPCFPEVSQISCQLEYRNPNPPVGNDHRHGTPPIQSSITMESIVSDIKIPSILRENRNLWVFNLQKLHMRVQKEL